MSNMYDYKIKYYNNEIKTDYIKNLLEKYNIETIVLYTKKRKEFKCCIYKKKYILYIDNIQQTKMKKKKIKRKFFSLPLNKTYACPVCLKTERNLMSLFFSKK